MLAVKLEVVMYKNFSLEIGDEVCSRYDRSFNKVINCIIFVVSVGVGGILGWVVDRGVGFGVIVFMDIHLGLKMYLG